VNKVKGASIVMIRKVVQDRGFSFEKDYLPRLTPQCRDDFKRLAVSWLDLPMVKEGSHLFEAAQLLFKGNEAQNLFDLGLATAKETPMFYKIFLSIPTKEFVLKKFDKMWKAYYDTGTMKSENMNSNSATIVLYDYPDYPVYLRLFDKGWLTGFFSLIKLKVTKVDLDDKDPQAIKWHVTWA
jgi:hypothetical protein